METGLAEFIRNALLVIGALFPIVNPLGSAPIFLALTAGFTDEAYALLARKIALNGFALLAASILVGTNIMAFFGISLPVVQVGGGMVVIAGGWSLLNRKDDSDAGAVVPKSTSPAEISRRAFYPLTLPLTVGPGSISVAITVGANHPQNAPRTLYLASALLGAAVVAVSIYFSYRFAEYLARAIGDAAMNIILRLSSFILLCIGVQIAWNGISALLRTAGVHP
jgi:multiple antibiotic resistance protein